MPLPPAPTQRAARLPEQAFAAAAPAARKSTARTAQTPPRAKPAPATASPVASAPTPAKAMPKAAPKPVQQAAAKPATKPAAVPKAAATPARTRKTRSKGPTKLFVLDTNVLLHDPTSLFRFEEHDIFLPMIVLEELDAHK